MTFAETTLTAQQVLDADEVFLTNAGFYIQWVKRFDQKEYGNDVSKQLYHNYIIPLLSLFL